MKEGAQCPIEEKRVQTLQSKPTTGVLQSDSEGKSSPFAIAIFMPLINVSFSTRCMLRAPGGSEARGPRRGSLSEWNNSKPLPSPNLGAS